jgi:hypothetical protein
MGWGEIRQSGSERGTQRWMRVLEPCRINQLRGRPLTPIPLPSRGERERISNGTANPGFRLRSTLGYKYSALSGAWAKQSTTLTPGSWPCGERGTEIHRVFREMNSLVTLFCSSE